VNVHKVIRATLLIALAVGLASAAFPANATHNADNHSPNMSSLFESPNGRPTGCAGGPCINTDIAFWGNRAYQGDYGGFRIFDISNPASPTLIKSFDCYGPQNDPVVWQNKLLFLAVDRTLTGPQCGATNAPHDDPNGWEGIRIFDVSNPANPTFVTSVYQDCGSHTLTLWPKNKNEILLYNSSYPLRPGPTCGPVRGPAAGRDPVHGVIQVVRVPVNNPAAAKEIAEPKVTYPGDPDNKFVPSEHGLGPVTDPTVVQGMRACHDIGVFVPLRIAGAACAEQAQVWRIRPNGLPDTQNPIWVYDDSIDETGTTGNVNDSGVVVDFWHSATFSWDGKVVNFVDESFGAGCPTETPAPGESATFPGDTGRTFFFDVATGQLRSQFMASRPWDSEYCSAHLGNVVPASDKYLLVEAWYIGGVNVIDFTNPANPTEAAFYDKAPPDFGGGDNWSAYWYEGPSLPESSLTIYGTNGVEDPALGRGFEVFKADIAANERKVTRLNPQTQEFLFPAVRCKGKNATLVGTNGNDRLVGTSGKDVIAALRGNDRVTGKGGKDLVCGAKGRDRLRGSGGNDRLYGQGDNDRLNGGAGVDLCSGGSGRDRARKCEVTRSIP
jgi:hypothetical protein